MLNGRQTLLTCLFFFTERMGKISGWFKTGLLLDKMSRACHCLRFIDKLDEMGNCMEYCTKGIVLSIKDYYDMANNDHKPVSPETKSIQPDMKHHHGKEHPASRRLYRSELHDLR